LFFHLLKVVAEAATHKDLSSMAFEWLVNWPSPPWLSSTAAVRN